MRAKSTTRYPTPRVLYCRISIATSVAVPTNRGVRLLHWLGQKVNVGEATILSLKSRMITGPQLSGVAKGPRPGNVKPYFMREPPCHRAHHGGVAELRDMLLGED